MRVSPAIHVQEESSPILEKDGIQSQEDSASSYTESAKKIAFEPFTRYSILTSISCVVFSSPNNTALTDFLTTSPGFIVPSDSL